jgi:hypothetical protein
MALELDVNLCPSDGCKEFKIYDTTGAYDPTSNDGGYGDAGGTNPWASLSTVSSLTLTEPDGTVYTHATVVGATPTVDPDAILTTITNEDLGLDDTDKIPDGIYTLTYVIEDTDGVLHSITCDFLVTCQLECCLDQKINDIDVEDCGCEDDDLNKLFKAYLILAGAKDAATCGKLQEAEDKLEFLQAFCNYTGCSDCD